MSSVIHVLTKTACATASSLKFNTKYNFFNTASNFSVVLTCSANLTADDSHVQGTGSGQWISSSITLLMDTHSSEINCTVTLDAFSISTIEEVECKYCIQNLLLFP